MDPIKLLFKEECSLYKGLKNEKTISFGEAEIAYVQPCASERGKVTADIVMSKEEKEFFNFEIVCLILDLYKIMFAEERCSQALGTAMIKWRGREIIIFKNGRINIKRALNKEEIEKILDSLTRLLLGSIICDNCKKPLIDCAFGKCRKCMNIKEGVKIDANYFKKALTGLFIIKSLEKFYEAAKKILNYSLDLTIFDTFKLFEVYKSINEAAFESLNCINEASSLTEVSLGLITLSLAVNFKIAIQKALNMSFLNKEEIAKTLVLISKTILDNEEFKEEIEKMIGKLKNNYSAINKVEELINDLNQLKLISSLFK
jgi:hypothetical protein